MFSSLRCLLRAAQSSRQAQLCTRRGIAYTPSLSSELGPEPPSLENVTVTEAVAEVRRPSGYVEEKSRPESYNQFLQEIGDKFRTAQPRNWLGGEVPFPMNPSFKPPPPISDALRSKIYHEFMSNPLKNTVRELSQRYHLSMKRVDAILRLKGMEAAWIKGKQLQTGFQQGMEKLLATHPDLPATESTDWIRYDAREADSLEEAENRDAARQRYERHYWESISEGRAEPILPASLQKAKDKAKLYSQQTEQAKSDSTLMPSVSDTKTIKTHRNKIKTSTKPGRPTIEFVDVGGKFIDVDERLRRVASSHRRRGMKSKPT